MKLKNFKCEASRKRRGRRRSSSIQKKRKKKKKNEKNELLFSRANPPNVLRIRMRTRQKKNGKLLAYSINPQKQRHSLYKLTCFTSHMQI